MIGSQAFYHLNYSRLSPLRDRNSASNWARSNFRCQRIFDAAARLPTPLLRLRGELGGVTPRSGSFTTQFLLCLRNRRFDPKGLYIHFY